MAAAGHATAMVWEGGMSFRAAELPLPVPADGEVLVRLEAATICGSDRHTVAGRRAEIFPSILGHEGVGRIAASRRPGVEAGERVVFSVTSNCGNCVRCRRGMTAKCEQVRKVGHEGLDGGWPLSGTYATHLLVQAGQTLAPVPAQLPSAIAATAGCAVATVMAALERAGDLRERRVLVSGVGMLGVMALAAARTAGAGHLIASDPDPRARELASGLADEVVVPSALGPSELAGPVVDIALELSGARAGVAACLDALDVGGIAVLAGTVTSVPAVPLDPEHLVRGLRTVTGVHNYEPRHLRAAVDFLTGPGAELPWDRLLSRPIGLADLPAAFEVPDGAPRTPVML